MSDKPIIIAICGASATGKDTLAKFVYNDLVKQGVKVHNIVSATTRPPREAEEDGINYHFLTTVDFLQKAINKEFLEYTKFRGWYYGTPRNEIQEGINIGVFNVQGLHSLTNYKDKYTIIPVYLEAGLKTRLQRSYEREHKWKFEFLRRAWVDHQDFKNINNLLWSFEHHLCLDEFDTLVNKIHRVELILESKGAL